MRRHAVNVPLKMDLGLTAEEKLHINSKWKKPLQLMGILLMEARNEWEVISSLTAT